MPVNKRKGYELRVRNESERVRNLVKLMRHY